MLLWLVWMKLVSCWMRPMGSTSITPLILMTFDFQLLCWILQPQSYEQELPWIMILFKTLSLRLLRSFILFGPHFLMQRLFHCWFHLWIIRVNLVLFSMSGCYVLCLSNSDPFYIFISCVPSALVCAFYCIANHQWQTTKILPSFITTLINL